MVNEVIKVEYLTRAHANPETYSIFSRVMVTIN